MEQEGDAEHQSPTIEIAEIECRIQSDFETDETANSVLQRIADEFNLTIVSTQINHFEPQGTTCLAVVAESHISVHTWPEYDYAHVEIFSCRALPPEDDIRERVSKIVPEVRGVDVRRRGSGKPEVKR